MKLIASLGLAAALLAAQPASAALKVFACEPEWGALALALGGKNVEVYTATTALQDVHRIQPRPSLIAKYRQAELLVCTGAELEIGWMPALAEKGNNPRVAPGSTGYFEASRYVPMLEIPVKLDRAEGDVHPYGNPHIQTSPANIARVAKPLADKLAELDAAHAADYHAAQAQFDTRWQAAMARWTEKARPLQGVAVVSAHKSWAYLYQWLGLREVATLEPKPGIPPSGAQLENVLATLKTQPAKLVVYAAYQDRRPVDWLLQRSGLAAVELPFSPGGVPGTDDLFGTFDVTIDRLLQGLAGAKP
ncbi:zinc ABC transporter substrate-binding protein [Solimonas sp. K1W22B-7]|uniref:metal ABC transporter solute-binding protein, Zn/Mn family n=1 Tax=Solimonas sp. K1W22B-7 TaxID=2303331 RepID=UPI000E33167F|nr:zinc ABC transporter substrate-binding protein [Solimonas sp. K1W22B-7]AXQ30365.1 zinc ABC transporter substrate-binding protein [Solimonas sp. K1W22B-7]